MYVSGMLSGSIWWRGLHRATQIHDREKTKAVELKLTEWDEQASTLSRECRKCIWKVAAINSSGDFDSAEDRPEALEGTQFPLNAWVIKYLMKLDLSENKLAAKICYDIGTGANSCASFFDSEGEPSVVGGSFSFYQPCVTTFIVG